MSNKFRKKPVVIEAIQFTKDSYRQCEQFIGKENYDNTLNYPNIKTLEGVMSVSIGDYIIKGVKGEFYACKPDVFEMTYEPADTVSKTQSLLDEAVAILMAINTEYDFITVKNFLQKYEGHNIVEKDDK